MNICGCLVHVAPRHKETAEPLIEETDGCEIHGRSDDGRFVVVVEDTSTRLASDTIMELHQIPGVVSVTLTYHHFEELSGIDESKEPLNGGQFNDHF